MTSFDEYDFIHRRCYNCGCCLRFQPLRPPVWFIGSVCTGCGITSIPYDTPQSFEDAAALAERLGVAAATPEAQEEARHWEASAARIRKREARSFRERFLRRFPERRACLRTPTLDAPELLVIPLEHPQRSGALTVTQRLNEISLHWDSDWGGVGWSHYRHPRTLSSILTTLSAILSDQLITTLWYRQGASFCISSFQRGEPLRLPHRASEMESVAFYSWSGAFDRTLKHPEETMAWGDGVA